jgi:hypothetical protein
VEEGGPIANPVCIKNRYSLTLTLARQPIRSSLSFDLAGHPSIHLSIVDARECVGGLLRLSSNSPNGLGDRRVERRDGWKKCAISHQLKKREERSRSSSSPTPPRARRRFQFQFQSSVAISERDCILALIRQPPCATNHIHHSMDWHSRQANN